MEDLIFNEKLREAHEKWAHCQMLVVVLSREFVEHPRDRSKRAELRAILKAEQRARLEFEGLLHAEQLMKAREIAEIEKIAEAAADGKHDGKADGHGRHDGKADGKADGKRRKN